MSHAAIMGVHLEWEMHRSDRAFVVHVVEPASYNPPQHGAIFNAVITHLLTPPRRQILSGTDDVQHGAPTPFDLIAFPEAFVTADALIGALDAISNAGSMGCVHVGLRSTNQDNRHLFTVNEIETLVGRIIQLDTVITADLEVFREWLSQQRDDLYFNVGALFAVDRFGNVRICLHPKQVRSQFESAPSPEQNMAEADLLSVITLHPSDKKLRSVTIQPIICSDFLRLPRDRNGVPPIHGVNAHPEKLSKRPPDHVDVVSVVTCTPQRQSEVAEGRAVREWHEKFLKGFEETQDGSLPRHNFATVILANFRELKSRAPGGLSGAFMPIPMKSGEVHPNVVMTYFGRETQHARNRWSGPHDEIGAWQNLGFVAGLDPFSEPLGSPVRIFGFTIQRLPRDNAIWDRKPGLTNCAVSAAAFDADGMLHFRKESLHD